MPELWLMFLLLVLCFPTSSGNGCPDQYCGNMSIPYPFGIGQGCFRDIGFEITCNKTKDGTERPFLVVGPESDVTYLEVLNLSLVPPQARVNGRMSYNCYDISGKILPYNSFDYYLSLGRYRPCRFSNTRNEFTAVGCTTIAYINSSIPGFTDSINRLPYTSQCQSLCYSTSSMKTGDECAGVGCCQTNIPRGLSYHQVAFDYLRSINAGNLPYTRGSIRCSYGFLAEKGWYTFNVSDVTTAGALYYRNNNGTVPVVLDWAISGGGTSDTGLPCEQAMLNPAEYACISKNSYCFNSTNAPGYNCNCSAGYHGNPYILDGCTDVDECTDMESYGCYGVCTNTPGSFNCSCPHGKHGNASIKGGCTTEGQLPLAVSIPVISALCCLIVVAILYLVYEKAKLTRAKRECFRQNGGLLLQQQINSNKSTQFKIFSLEEIEKATNNFHHEKFIGGGGQGKVYLGDLKNYGKVAIKKSNETAMRYKKYFAREMYILSLVNHKHVIKIIGCCLEAEVLILVYEFLPGGTLLQNIQNGHMHMSFRLKVAIDCASALAYLHSDASDQILHRDIKSSNILLKGSIAKLSDFGASVLPSKDTTEKGMPGTLGYIDPESIHETGVLTDKSDVYSFAVVILELLSGRKAVYAQESGDRASLVQVFKDKGLANIVDDRIKSEVTEEQIEVFAQLLGRCLKYKGEERPEMTAVVALLRRMRDVNPNLSQKWDNANADIAILDSSDGATGSSFQYFSMEHPETIGSGYQHLR